MRHPRTLAAALAGAALAAAPLAAPLAVPAAADAPDARPPRVIKLDVDWYGVAFSPDRDGVQDRGRVHYELAQRSRVVVKVRRADRAATLVRKVRLGSVAAGDRSWAWDGRNDAGRRVRDGKYVATLVAEQVAAGGRKKSATTAVYLDTHFDVPWAVEMTDDTVYPRTPGPATDVVHVGLGSTPDNPLRSALGEVKQTLRDASGTVVVQRPFVEYHTDEYHAPRPLAVSGLDRSGDPLPAGAYRLSFKVRDLAGNPGGARSVTLVVSDRPLVLATGSVVLRVAQPFAAPPPGAAPSGRRGGDDPPQVPCGSVVPSQVYAEATAMSLRSSDACGGTWTRPSIALGSGVFDLADVVAADQAPRGLSTAYAAVRGRPTVAGETDTAVLTTYGGSTVTAPVRSAVTTEETVTASAPITYTFETPYAVEYPHELVWNIQTEGNDSFDAAGLTVHFTYLTPQP